MKIISLMIVNVLFIINISSAQETIYRVTESKYKHLNVASIDSELSFMTYMSPEVLKEYKAEILNKIKESNGVYYYTTTGESILIGKESGNISDKTFEESVKQITKFKYTSVEIENIEDFMEKGTRKYKDKYLYKYIIIHSPAGQKTSESYAAYYFINFSDYFYSINIICRERPKIEEIIEITEK